ncbi:hypothetical protein P885DRAFT_25583 [Corynascus similis CBS 632.67]
MAEDDQGDPFFWEEDRVVQELCTANRSWKAPPAKRLPDPVALEVKLRECGVDGQTLLTYGDEFSFNDLWGYLGVKKLPHQLSLKDAITQLRSRSKKYREWKTQQLATSQPFDEEDDNLAIRADQYKPADSELVGQPSSVTGPISDNATPEPRGDVRELSNTFPGVLSPTPSASVDCDLPASRISQVARGNMEEPPSKKRRIAPMTISNETTGNNAFTIIPTEGDTVHGADVPPPDAFGTVLQEGDSSGFLGSGILRPAQLFEFETMDASSPADHVFALLPRQLPPGRRIQVAAAMKRFLRASLADRLAPNNLGFEKESEYGASDDGSVDSETWREYEQEEAERAASEAIKDTNNERLLSKEELTEAVRTAIQELEARWMIEKKPKYDRKALKTWQDARRNPDRAAFIDSAKRELDHFVNRIALYSTHIIDQPWTVNNDVQRKASGILEASIFDKMRQTWLIDVVESPFQPPRPSRLPRPVSRREDPTALDDDEEVLTSDSDEMEAFIEDDDGVAPRFHGGMEIDSEFQQKQTTTSASPNRTVAVTLEDGADVSSSPTRTLFSGEQTGDILAPGAPTPKPIKVEQHPMLKTPRRTASSSPPEIIEIESSPSPLKQLSQIPGLDDFESLKRIGEIGTEYWRKVEDSERLVVAVLCEWSVRKREEVYEAIRNRDHPEIWTKYMAPVLDAQRDVDSTTTDLAAFCLCRLFDVFASKTAKRSNSSLLRRITLSRMKREGNWFASFCALLKRILPVLLRAVPQTPIPTVLKTPQKVKQRSPTPAEDRVLSDNLSALDESSSEDLNVSSTKKRRRVKRRDAQAAKIRSDELKRREELAQRTRELRERLAQQGSVLSKHARLIVNETKASDDQALIYINDYIGSKIKDHQIEGVRFMWNQLVVDSTVRQGCLLAHTMGLGKTMQVITLLVVIAESSMSPDESVRSQIPENLRESKTLILCPPTLIDNWQEEIRMWAPGNILGPVYRVDSISSPSGRMKTIQAWASSGGVLILGYAMFTILVRGTEGARELLLETPNIVVGDEAHYMKNPDSQRHQATANFRTMSRIAMTGSPLTNNVMDYYAMINWVAPNYLADIAEFRERYSNPIKEGLYADSEASKKRKARRMLHVLQATVDPKVHRRDIDVLRNELPKKKEFIITLPLTRVQKQVYETYIKGVESRRQTVTSPANAWGLVAKLSLALAHPIIFRTNLEAPKAKSQKVKAGGSSAQVLGSSTTATTGQLDDENEFDLPQDTIIQLRAILAIRNIEDYNLSNKILVLLRILDECKKVGDKVLVFSQRMSTLDYLENIFKRQRVVYQRLDGNTLMSTRQNSVKKFNRDSEIQVYLISTTVGGLGLNIYGANRVVIFDFRYTPAEEQQAIARAYRLGQLKPVYVYWLTIGGTFEDTILKNAVFKTQLAFRVVDKKNPDPWSSRFSEYFMMPRELDQQDLSRNLGQDKVLDALLQSDEVGKLIRKITSTETFEREETYELTPEERQEAEKDIEMERLRLQNPEKFRMREQERFLQSRNMLGVQPLPHNVFSEPRPADGESSLTASNTDNRNNRIVKIKVPEHLREQWNPEPPVSDVVSETRLAQCNPSASQPADDDSQQQLLTLAFSALVNRPIPITTQLMNHAVATTGQGVRVQNNQPLAHASSSPNATALTGVTTQVLQTVPQPILGAGSHFKNHQASLSVAPASESLVVGNPSISPPTTAVDLEVDFPDLLAVHSTLCRDGRHVRQHPRDLINRVQAVWAREKIEKLPMMDKIQSLKSFSVNPRFAEAMLSGFLEPEQLASMTRLEMEEISATLDGLAQGEFKKKVWTTKADLNVCNTGTEST